MKLSEYKVAAMRTCRFPTDKEKMFAHATLGLLSETGEVCGIFQKTYQGHDVNPDELVKELGDVMWMCAELVAASGYEFRDIDKCDEDLIESCSLTTERLCSCLCSRAVSIVNDYYSLGAVPLSTIMGVVVDVKGIGGRYGFTMDDILRTNVSKLLERYPNGFEVDRSINRKEAKHG